MIIITMLKWAGDITQTLTLIMMIIVTPKLMLDFFTILITKIMTEKGTGDFFNLLMIIIMTFKGAPDVLHSDQDNYNQTERGARCFAL